MKTLMFFLLAASLLAAPNTPINNLVVQNSGVAQTGLLQGNGTTPVAAATAANVSTGLDLTLGTTRGSVPYRNATSWVGLSPGTAGHVLTSNGTGADPSYQAVVSSAQGTAGQVLVSGTSGSAQTGAVVFALPSSITGVNSVTAASGQDISIGNATNNKNIVLNAGNGGGQVLVPDGSGSSASLAFFTTTDSGLSANGPHGMSIWGGGSEMAIVNSTRFYIISAFPVHASYTVATLPSAGGNAFAIVGVSDATNAAGTGLGTSPTGGGSVKRMVYSDGTNWLLL